MQNKSSKHQSKTPAENNILKITQGKNTIRPMDEIHKCIMRLADRCAGKSLTLVFASHEEMNHFAHFPEGETLLAYSTIIITNE